MVQMSEKQMVWLSSEGARHDIYIFLFYFGHGFYVGEEI